MLTGELWVPHLGAGELLNQKPQHLPAQLLAGAEHGHVCYRHVGYGRNPVGLC